MREKRSKQAKLKPKQEARSGAKADRSSEKKANPHKRWQASYADLGMILLAIFVFAISTDKTQRNRVTQIIKSGITQSITQINTPAPEKLALYTESPATRTLATTAPAAWVVPDSPPGLQPANENPIVLRMIPKPVGLISKLQSVFSSDSIHTSQQGGKLTLLLPENVYAPGKFNLSNTKILNGVLQKLRSFDRQIRITFVGHSDPSPLHHFRGKYLSDNFDLSALRATRALQHAVHFGLSPDHMSAKASAEHERRSRTLSVVIETNSGSPSSPRSSHPEQDRSPELDLSLAPRSPGSQKQETLIARGPRRALH